MKLKTKKMAKRFKVTENYDVILACCSGGKDSTVATFLASLFVPLEKLYVLYYSSPWDFPGTREQVKEFCRRVGLNLIITFPDVDLDECLVNYSPPNFRNRWCTRIIKEEPSLKVIAGFPGKKIIFIDGSRREESRARSMLQAFMPGRFEGGHDVLCPIHDWTKKRVWHAMRAYELPIHPIYRWSNRLSCFCCPLQSKGSWLSLRRFHPELFKRALEMEALAGKPWLMRYQWLRDLESATIPEGLKEPMIIARRYRDDTELVEVRT